MKHFPQPMDVMKIMFQYIADAYNSAQMKEKGVLQFCLQHIGENINCYFVADGIEMKFFEGVSDNYNVRLESSLANWLSLAENKLNPIWGVISRKLKFKGDVSYFKKIIPNDLYKVDLSAVADSITDFEANPSKNWIKPRRVLLIDASPRGTKGYTKLYSDKIEEFLKETGVEVNHIMLSKYKIQPCLGCLQCWLKYEGECIVKDDVKELYEQYEEADLIIYSFPLYAYGVPGTLKNFIDRGVVTQYPYFEQGISEIRHPRRIKTNKAFVVFSICGFPSFSQYNSVKEFFKLYSHSHYSPLVAEIYRPGGIFLLQNPFNYMKLIRFLDALRTATHEIIEIGKIKSSTQRKLNVKIDKNLFLQSTNKYWDNMNINNDSNY